MPRFEPVSLTSQLPPLKSGIERSILDFKGADYRHHFERAKDVTAFANHLGGSIIVGASEVDGVVTSYHGLSQKDAEHCREKLSEAVAQRCNPLPHFDTVQFPSPTIVGNFVVVANVWPSLTLVAVKIKSDSAEGKQLDAWTFPLRVGIKTEFIQPGQLNMYQTPDIRRKVILLHQITANDRIAVKFTGLQNGWMQDYTLVAVREENNVIDLMPAGETRVPISISLDAILDVSRGIIPGTERAAWRILWNVG